MLPDFNPEGKPREHIAELTGNRRLTTFGDVIVNPDGQAYRVDDTRTGPVCQIIHFAPEVERRALFAEQLEEAHTGAVDALVAGVSLRQVMQEAGVYGVKPEEVEAIRREVDQDGRER